MWYLILKSVILDYEYHIKIIEILIFWYKYYICMIFITDISSLDTLLYKYNTNIIFILEY